MKEGSWESRGAQKARREHGLRNFAAKVSRCEMVSQPPSTLCEMVTKPPRLEILHFAIETPFGRVFRSCEATFWHTSAISQHSDPHFAAAKRLRSIKTPNFAAKAPFCRALLGCKITSKLRNGYEMISKLRNGCQIISKLRNGLQIAKLT